MFSCVLTESLPITSFKSINRCNRKRHRIYKIANPLKIYLHWIARCKAVVSLIAMKVDSIVFLILTSTTPPQKKFHKPFTLRNLFSLHFSVQECGISIANALEISKCWPLTLTTRLVIPLRIVISPLITTWDTAALFALRYRYFRIRTRTTLMLGSKYTINWKQWLWDHTDVAQYANYFGEPLKIKSATSG